MGLPCGINILLLLYVRSQVFYKPKKYEMIELESALKA